jgi:hypothetical protein
MKVKTYLLVGAVAAATAGAAQAAPVQSLAPNFEATADASAEPVHYGWRSRRICYVPFFRLAAWYGPWQARMIKRNCFASGAYGYYGYPGHYGYRSYYVR